MHHSVLSLLGYDVAVGKWYGVSKDGNAIVKSSSHSSKFIGAALSEWDAAKVKSTTIHAKMIENHLAITNSTLNTHIQPQNESSAGTKWGGQYINTRCFNWIRENYFPGITKSLTTAIWPTLSPLFYLVSYSWILLKWLLLFFNSSVC